MCKYTYHHYPFCGHISNWTVVSCLEFTSELRALAFTGQVLSCDRTKIKHIINQTAKQDLCAQCDIEWCEAMTSNDMDALLDNKYRVIEGLDAARPVLEFSVRMNRDTNSDRAESSSPSVDIIIGTSEQFDVSTDIGHDSNSHDSSRPRPRRGMSHRGSASSSLSIESGDFTLSITYKSTDTDPWDCNSESQPCSDSQRHRHIRIQYRKPKVDRMRFGEYSSSEYSPRVDLACPPTQTPGSSSSSITDYSGESSIFGSESSPSLPDLSLLNIQGSFNADHERGHSESSPFSAGSDTSASFEHF
ncbi:uncharacterized protein N7498_000701 [Penicillium cinerascens]|uniref:Uncharacterized protein n=1 Tax=Penicillium cinerascens TaxID=70096 RepID=A0A9W9NF10_9EURO|nr:uncharacterized protein N7498_000701 [Penicillium cinerascens]KAJ5218602.1 hypothetical protein N7498_000701 [Penicillium cinerascens]